MGKCLFNPYGRQAMVLSLKCIESTLHFVSFLQLVVGDFLSLDLGYFWFITGHFSLFIFVWSEEIMFQSKVLEITTAQN